MGITYKKLWHLLIDRDMLKKDLREGCELSTASMAKLAKGRNINTDVLVRVCNFLRCDISDICEVILAGEETEILQAEESQS
ncbi:MAG: helix-turn-helix transcriptional regulator [Clostridiales bacterium]|jgi:DNA-binding Xre family transcriptional regulator|nr:helix-turn-helix transcriptional regulator [Clostridiales bacterium]